MCILHVYVYTNANHMFVDYISSVRVNLANKRAFKE